ncbi:LA_2444/LA_4059 family outer membrane protein [Leptospira paudalimensis]|uniref:LA_2444/LA_4059 family outer membrane protein n=1 Tax=Leptospira paudalimensis TaxID=2950024 RepID=A0ABT3M583_9LEPT|nr:LA_2444/LA_4059 family outer membrane protein [Leptospira paudalimensis]MCW7503547.1 LA_2444/LA_4059 family outer membrane protein [Leptospira paudalimensis]
MKNKKVLIITAFLILNLCIYAEEETENKQKERKSNQIYLRRNNGYVAPNELNIYNSIFPFALASELPSIQYNTFGFNKFLGDSKFSIEGNFYEFKKTNTTFDRINPTTGFYSKGNLGTFYRSEQNLFLNYHLIENRIILNVGLQRLQSNLSDGTYGFNNYNFSQNFKGIAAGFLLESPRFYGFYIASGYRYSVLNGISNINYSIVTSARRAETLDIQDNPATKYLLREIKLVLGYELNDSILLSLGYIDQFANIKLNRSNIIATDLYFNLLVRSAIEVNARSEYSGTTFASITYKF